MKHHYFERDYLGSDRCELCGETVDAKIHEMDGEPPNLPCDIASEDWPPSVVAYLESAGIRNRPNT